ncbi:MAG: hypothetical protein Q9165_006275 [Trypethelium subeluteriae]
MGYIDYEACLETISAAPNSVQPGRPNISFAFIERSIVISHEHRLLTIQSIRDDDDEWVCSSAEALRNFAKQGRFELQPQNQTDGQGARQNTNIKFPSRSVYSENFHACQKNLAAGDSYELCLTDQTSINVPRNDIISNPSWDRYQHLRACNPAPFAAYVRLGPLTLMSSSPERFLSWSKPEKREGDRSDVPVSVCQFRPIKGTVKKTTLDENGRLRLVTKEEATRMLSTPKEQAENLMIVDLIRHDLAGVVGAKNINVPYLMRVEEYEIMYQLVTVVEGYLHQPIPEKACAVPNIPLCCRSDSRTGIDVLAASLPPGSMTGAPKKSSCEILRKIEQRSRSVYSGLLGYMDICGQGDFSVIIRTIFKWDDEQTENELWHIGAGGAITALSTEEGEWDEMMAKLHSVFSLFD